MKRLIAFDLDGTLAESKQPVDAPMAHLLSALLAHTCVAVISGGDWPQFQTQVIGRLPADAKLENLFIMPTTGAKLYRYSGDAWHQVYADDFSEAERTQITDAIDAAAKQQGLDKDKSWGDRIEDRGSQITFSGLGQQAPLDAKKAWDPDMAKRKALQSALEAALLDLSIKVGGSTSIDITRKGVDKAYAIRRLAEHSGIPAEDMLFFGDAMYPGGNDYPVKAAGTDAIAVRDVTETKTAVSAILTWIR